MLTPAEPPQPTRVGVYIDGYNLYYGAREVCGRGTPGWRWLDLRSLVTSLVTAQRGWPGAVIDRIVYCTARIDAKTNRSGFVDQDVYLKALVAAKSVDQIVYGKYVSRVRVSPLATKGKNGRPDVEAAWPLTVHAPLGTPVKRAVLMVSHLHQEEKGTDVNLATHMLIDVLDGHVDGVVVVSNDSDLGLPVRSARLRVPVGHVNPRQTWFAGDLRGRNTDGVTNHWWRRLSAADYQSHQLPDPAGGYPKPIGW